MKAAPWPMPTRPPPKADAPHAPQHDAQHDASRPAKKAPPMRPPNNAATAISQAQSRERRAAQQQQQQVRPPPARADEGPPQEESEVEPHDGADFDRAPSPSAASTPRDSQPAEEQSRSVPVADGASEGGAVAASEASEERSASKAMPAPSMNGGDSPEEEDATRSSGEKPAAQEDPSDEFVCMLVFHGVIDHVFFCVRGVDWVTCGLWAGEGAGGR